MLKNLLRENNRCMQLGKLVQYAVSDMTSLTDLELQDLHQVLLQMLDDFLKVCESNQLSYYFIGGSAIGALRHKGFIPWDNDIDLAMPRKDFLKLCSIIESSFKESYSILNPLSAQNFGRVLAKLRKRGTIYQTILETELDDCGIFIDVYIIENTYNSILLRTLHGLLCLAAGFVLSCRRAYEKKELYLRLCRDNAKEKAIFSLKNFIGKILSYISIEKIAQWTNACYGLCKNENSNYITVPSDGGYFFGNLYKRSEFNKKAFAEFESRIVSLPGNYKTYLKDKYGDYMKTPAQDSRKYPLYLKFHV